MTRKPWLCRLGLHLRTERTRDNGMLTYEARCLRCGWEGTCEYWPEGR